VFKHNEAFSFQIATDDQKRPTVLERHRRQWRPGERVRLVQGQVGRLLAITPRVLTEAMARGGDEAKRAFER
jgi:predicted 3-demethylubiquinone-9 3-methyltransferase (glyoxalase superfamily)